MTCHWIRPNVRHIGILLPVSTISPQSTCHSALVCEILSKSDDSRQKMMSCRFSRCQISAILDFMGPIMGSLKSAYCEGIDIINRQFWLLCWLYGDTFSAHALTWRYTTTTTDNCSEQWSTVRQVSTENCLRAWVGRLSNVTSPFCAYLSALFFRPSRKHAHESTDVWLLGGMCQQA